MRIGSVVLLAVLAAIVGLVVLGVRRLRGRGGPSATPADPFSRGHAVRRFFQYLLLFGTVVVVGIGVAGLLGQLLDRSSVLNATPAESALNGAFVVVGIPLCTGLAFWSRRALTRDAAEVLSPAWVLYITATCLTSLAVAMFAAHDLLIWAVGVAPYNGRALARLIVWSGIWGFHWRLDVRLTPAPHSRPHQLAGSLIGLGTAATGLAGLLAGAVDVLIRLGDRPLVEAGDPIRQSAATLLVGAPVWYLYWVRRSARSDRTPLWLAYVLLAGIGGGLVAALVSSSRVLYDALVWLLGDTSGAQASEHFRAIPTSLAATGVGVLVWWYHDAVMREPGQAVRTEVQRVYEYLMAGVSLLAAGAGLTVLIAASIEAATSSSHLVGGSAVNTLLLAATLLAVGGSVWTVYWLRIQRIARAAPQDERSSPTRRIFLFVLLGIGGVAAAVTALVAVYFLFEDLFAGRVTAATLRRMRYPLGVLVTAGALTGYHMSVYWAERALAATERHHRRFVLLVGPRDPELTRAVALGVGARVQSWPRTDDRGAPWSVDDVVALVEHTSSDDVIVVSEADGLHAIPVDRG